MFSLFGRNPKIPDGMIQLRSLPVDDNGAPTWTAEIETETKRFGREFVAPLMYETSPGQCIGGYVAKAVFETQIRTYLAKATLLQRKNDEFRTTVVVTAPAVAGPTGGPWNSYRRQYNASLPKEEVGGLVNALRQLCEKSHAEELEDRNKSDIAETARLYDPENMRQLTNFLETNYQSLNAAQNDPEMVEFGAGFACEVAVFVRSKCQVDLCTLSFPIEEPPLRDSHPLMQALPLLDRYIKDYFESIASDPTNLLDLQGEAQSRRVEAHARMSAACMWKGYLFTLATEPSNWREYNAYALGALRILSTADPARVIGNLRQQTIDSFAAKVRDDDWPPQAFISLYLKNADLVAAKLLNATTNGR